ncbi:hypothetical protein Pan97_34140 [Bremerella volcania]|uniref:Uncharacterized protein n=1 Tax=Bremerella volcania TaxID=2527984 RepID=A0A518CAV9_9BACT|nr:hypothetical protein Pan97_34140 [Bremerella volcania]
MLAKGVNAAHISPRYHSLYHRFDSYDEIAWETDFVTPLKRYLMIFFVVYARQLENSNLNAGNSPKSLDNNDIRESTALTRLRN